MVSQQSQGWSLCRRSRKATETLETERVVPWQAEGGPSAGTLVFSGIRTQASEVRAFVPTKYHPSCLSIELEHVIT